VHGVEAVGNHQGRSRGGRGTLHLAIKQEKAGDTGLFLFLCVCNLAGMNVAAPCNARLKVLFHFLLLSVLLLSS